MIAKVKDNFGFIHDVSIQVLNPTPDTLILRFPYNKTLIQEVKESFTAPRYTPPDEGGPYWSVKNNERAKYNLAYLSGSRPVYGDYYKVNPKKFPELFDHQVDIVSFILARKRCLIAAEMGLGKTLATLRAMELLFEQGIFNWWLVAPLGAQKEWKRQAEKWDAPIQPVVVTTYESLQKKMDTFPDPPQGVIFDESIKIKNHAAQRSQVAGELCRLIRQSSGYIILLSGAPAPKIPTDWWHQIECIQPGHIREGNPHKFRERLAVIVKKQGDYGPYKEVESWKDDEIASLGKRLKPLVLVKKKKDCLDLPDKVFDRIVCQANEQLLAVARALVAQAESPLMALEKLRELSDGFQYETGDDGKRSYNWVGSPKLDILTELLDFYQRSNGGPGRLVIYACFQATIDHIFTYLSHNKDWEPFRIDGRGWSDERTLDFFDNNIGNYCIVANPGCVHGLNLQRTNALVYYSNSFSPDHRIQSLDRRDRPGMDLTKGTRIVDIINLETDRLILEKLEHGIAMQEITLQEIQKCLKSLEST